MARSVLAFAVLLGGIPAFLFAQEKFPLPDTTLLDVQNKRGADESTKLTIYKPRHMTESQALKVVSQLMGDRVDAFIEPSSHSVVFRASEDEAKKVHAILEELDQPASDDVRMIAFEVLFADVPPVKPQPAEGQPAAGGEKPVKDPPTSEEAWLSRLKNPDDKIKGNISTIRLTATENQQAMVQFGGQTPIVTGVQQGFGGRGGAGGRSAIIQQTSTGTIVQCTARVLKDNTIIAELNIERSRLAPEAGTVLDESDDRDALRTPGMLTTTCKTTVKLKPGKPRIVSGIDTKAGPGSSLNLIVITAELLEGE